MEFRGRHSPGRLWELEDLTSVSELAREFGVTRQAVDGWAKSADFPAPLVRLGSWPIYSRREVTEWHARKSLLRAQRLA